MQQSKARPKTQLLKFMKKLTYLFQALHLSKFQFQWHYLYLNKILAQMKKTNTLTKLTVLLVGFIFLTADTRNVQVSPIKIIQPLKIQTKVAHIIQDPKYPFKKIRTKQILKRQINDLTSQISFCKSNFAEFQMKVLYQVQFQDIPHKSELVYNFQDILQSEYLLDLLYDQSKIYAIFKNHKIIKISLKQNGEIEKIQNLPIEGTDKNTNLKLGQFVKTDKNILFINEEHVIKIGSRAGKVLDGYRYKTDSQFVEAIAIKGGIFAVLYKQYGVLFYQDVQNQNLVRQVGNYNSNHLFLNTDYLTLTDIEYQKQKNVLLLSDYRHGIMSYTTQLQGSNLTLKEGQFRWDVKKCKLMFFNKNDLSLFCSKVIVFNITNWPEIEIQQTYQADSDIKQFFKLGNFFLISSRKSLSVSYLGMNINFMQQKSVNELIITQDFYIAAKQNGIQIGKFVFSQPYIQCQVQDEVITQPIPVLIKTHAQCNKQFLQLYNIDSTNLNEEDICIYNVQRTIQIIYPKEIDYIPIIIGLSVVILALLVLICYFVMKRCQLKNYKFLISQLSNRDLCDSGKFQELNDDSPTKKQKSNKIMQTTQNKQTTVQEFKYRKQLQDSNKDIKLGGNKKFKMISDQ